MDDTEENGSLPEEEADATLTARLADPDALVEARVSEELRKKFEFFSYKNAAVILAETHPQEWSELLDALTNLSITTEMLTTAGGNESAIPKHVSSLLRPSNWHETVIRGDLVVKLLWKEQVGVTKGGKVKFAKRESEQTRKGYLDGHKIDYVKNRVAFDLEWNSKDQTFDRDLYAFNAFYQAGAIDAAVLLTRSRDLNDVFRDLGIAAKYGASTTWMGKLIYRLDAGRNGGCPVLAIGIKPDSITDWKKV
ncbi:BglII/BstYI family type II restriction endonuclease [Neorhizobium alkalisoli]|uniref:BglII/BstYI family type II restriction endonuclease n=1 Tax=Neorhizobium alkalisoli TaxID=528178 RepID=UPI000CFA3EF5|nr:BglII/BstYI family type II restriction endonuclease [Neorhizobium alkalisoli]